MEAQGRAELPKGIAIGSRVRVKPDATPLDARGSVTPKSVGVITALRATGEDGYSSDDSDDSTSSAPSTPRRVGGLFGVPQAPRTPSLFGAAPAPAAPAFGAASAAPPPAAPKIMCVVDFDGVKGWEVNAAELEVVDAAGAQGSSNGSHAALLDHYPDNTEYLSTLSDEEKARYEKIAPPPPARGEAWRPPGSYLPCGKQAPTRNCEMHSAASIGVSRERPISREAEGLLARPVEYMGLEYRASLKVRTHRER